MLSRLRYLVFFFAVLFPVVYAETQAADNSDDKSSGLTIKLIRQKSAFEQHLNHAKLLKSYGLNNDWLYKKHVIGDTRTNDSIALYRYMDNEFYGQIVIGHPGQTLNVAFDTAWPYTWVLSEQCSVYTTLGCWFHNKYNHLKSSYYKADGRKISLPEGTDTLEGFFSYENISFAHSNVTNFSFIEITSVPKKFMLNKIDGVLGLALEKDGYEPFFYTLVRQKKIANAIFSIYLNRDKQSNKGGNIILGFIEKRHIHSHKDANNNTVYDDIIYMPVKGGYGLWQFDLATIYLNDDKTPLVFCEGLNCTALPDTSSNDILGPVDDIEKIHATIGASAWHFNRYSVPCDTINKLPVLAFNIGGTNFTLKGRDYIKQMSISSTTWCISAFVPHSYTNLWVLGGAFLSEYFTIYDVQQKQIGIVKAA